MNESIEMLRNLQFKFLMALGSNASADLNESSRILSIALKELNTKSIIIERISKYYQTPAFPKGAGPDFVNCAASGQTSLPPNELLTMFHDVESHLGRKRIKRWGQRSVDIDLIFYENMVKPDEKTFNYWLNLPIEQQMEKAPDQLLLPHPRIQDRAFVLVPLRDIAPNWRHPVLDKTVSELYADLSAELRNEVYQIDDKD
jgi:2-amino-4-hydroxy-6-hydroxymethyldihydropteridine diphosphokinase